MPRTKRGWIGHYDPLKLAVQQTRSRVIVGIIHGSGARIALDLGTRAGGLVSMLGRGEEDDSDALTRSEVEIDGKLFVAGEHSSDAASCEDSIEAWEGRDVPLRMSFEPEPRSLVWSVRDPQAARGFTIKLPTLARNALFAGFYQRRADRNLFIDGAGRIEGRLEVVL